MTAAKDIKVLIVDDQRTIRSLLWTSLKSLNFADIVEAEDGEAALRTMLTNPVRLVISDYNMPKYDGLTLLKAVRAHPQIKSTAFIMLTGQNDRDLVLSAKEHGVNNFLIKPFSTADLRKKIESVFGVLT